MRKGQVRANKTYKEGRICSECGATLSIYNKGKKCHTHKIDDEINPVKFGNPNEGYPVHVRLS